MEIALQMAIVRGNVAEGRSNLMGTSRLHQKRKHNCSTGGFLSFLHSVIVRFANIFSNNALTSVKETRQAFYSLLIGKKFYV